MGNHGGGASKEDWGEAEIMRLVKTPEDLGVDVNTPMTMEQYHKRGYGQAFQDGYESGYKQGYKDARSKVCVQ